MKNYISRFIINSVLILFIIISLLIIFNSVTKLFNGNDEYSSFFHIIIFLVSILFLIILLLSLSQRKEIKINITIILISITLTTYAVESYLYFLNKNYNSREIRAQQLKIPYDNRNKINVIDDLKKEGIDAYLKNVPILLSESNGIPSEVGNIFPLAGISESTTLLLNESGFYPIIETDEHGFNNPRGLYEDNIDILIIGDSYAEGDGVNSNENIAAFIRKKGYKVISLGQNGNGPLIEYASLREYGKYLKPKIVLWMYFVNDLGDLKLELNSSILKNYLSDKNFSQNLINRQIEIDYILKNYLNKKIINRKKDNKKQKINIPDEIIKLKNIGSLLNIIPKTYIESRGDVPKKEFEEILLQSKEIIENWGGKMHLIYLPSYFAYASKNENRFYNYVLETTKKSNISTIDIHREVFLQQKDPLELFSLKMNSHYNSKGYRIVAEEILKKIKEDNH